MLHLVVWYSGPGQHDNTNTEEDSQALINLERNIANLERSLSASQLQTVNLREGSFNCPRGKSGVVKKKGGSLVSFAEVN